MTSIIPVTPYLLTEYQAYLDHRRYGYTSCRGMMLAAQRVIDQFPDGIPLDEDQVVEAACTSAKTISTTRTMSGFGRRFYEFIETQSRSAEVV